jgi:tetratricopeptide (TPR) repeat protein
MMVTMRILSFTFVVALSTGSVPAYSQPAQAPGQPQPAQAPGAPPAEPLVRDGQQLLRDGQHEAALAAFQKAIAANPRSFPAHLQSGIVLDLMGRYAEARKHFTQAVELAPTPQNRVSARRAIAMSYAFERNCAGAAEQEAPLYDEFVKTGAYETAGEIANELARVCLESGDLAAAEKWYRAGYDAGPRQPDIKPEGKDLWDFRWEHAQARLAARRGNAAEARTHVDAARAILAKGTNPDQAQYLPYLVGYVAFYGGNYQAAVDELQKANQNDPFILALIAQAYEKLGDQARAAEYYKKVLASNAHNPTGAYARPLAKQKLRS